MGNETMSEVAARNAAAEKAMADAIQTLEEALSDAAGLPDRADRARGGMWSAGRSLVQSFDFRTLQWTKRRWDGTVPRHSTTQVPS